MEISEFIEYVRRYRHEFVGIAHHYFHDEHEVEDAVQDALIRLWMARERIWIWRKARHPAIALNRCWKSLKTNG